MNKLHLVSLSTLLAAPAFPRVTPDEEFLLRDWLRVIGLSYDLFSVDVPVGLGQTADGVLVGAFERMWTAITRRRVDLVAWRDAHVDIVEAKLHARPSTVTQVVDYVAKYRSDHPAVPWVRPLVVCRSATPGLERLLRQYGGALVEMPAIGEVPEVYFTNHQQENPHGNH